MPSKRLILCFVALLSAPMLLAQEPEPIAYVGHGAMFDQKGTEIEVTPEFVAKAQDWYRAKLLSLLPGSKKEELANFEKRLRAAVPAEGQTRLIVQQRALDWLAQRVQINDGGRTKSKLNALKYALHWRLDQRRDKEGRPSLEEFKLDPEIDKKLRTMDIGPVVVFLTTINSGQAYINECTNNGVPIPPTINLIDPNGTAGWKSQGFIPPPRVENGGKQFIVGTPAEVRTYTSAAGMCIALPRYTNSSLTTVALDGVICLSRTTSKVCFWDNQMSGAAFSFPANTQVPIGVPDLAINPVGQYQAGGAELEEGVGGMCTDCHAGENPYIIHPLVDLDGMGNLMGDLNGPPQNLPTFGPDRYDPIVKASWVQNALSHAAPLVPVQCRGCHQQGIAGRFPHLSSDIPGYCQQVLTKAVNFTMPPSAPGSLASNAAVVALLNWCNSAPSSGPSNRGDPHLTTGNGVNYDFQAAGEFISLRNSATRFELQTRQTPVSTTFIPGPNAYTGLASCVSLNTGVAFRLGTHRVTYQPSPAGLSTMDLRVDGTLVNPPPQGVDFGGGNWIANAGQEGALDAHAADGTRVLITPQFWTSQGYWYLNVEVLNTPAREGTMGHIIGNDWLPLGPNGSSFGSAPASIPARHNLLNQTFANSWRVTNATSLFDYAPGTSTDTFTFQSWPPEPGKPCIVPAMKPVAPMQRESAITLCSFIKDKPVFENCVFDLVATGEEGFAKAYQRSLQLRQDATALAPPPRRGCLVSCPPPARCVTPPAQMVGWWPLDESAGATSFKDLIGGNNATPFASPVGGTGAPQPVSGIVSGAIQFGKFGNGLSGARVSPQGALATVGAADFTIDTWVEFQSAPAGRPHYIVNKFDSVQKKGYAMYVISPGIVGNERLEFKWGDGANVTTIQTISALAPGKWHHVAVAFSRNMVGNALDIRLYVDGAQQGQQTGNPPSLGSLVNSVFLEIGWQPGTVDEPITLDELEIFNVALPPSDIQSIYNAGPGGKCK